MLYCAAMDPIPPAPRRRDGLTLLFSLGMVYLFVTATLPALLDRHRLADRRELVEQELTGLRDRVATLADWNDAAATDPLVRERLLETWRLAPDAPGYRVVDEKPAPSGVPAGHP